MTQLTTGMKAPEFEAKTGDGTTISSTHLRGKKVILYFYPKDDTPGCTKEACNFRDNYEQLRNHGFEVIGVSTDSEKSHKKFAEKFQLPFPLLADTEKEIANAFGVYGEKKFMGKTYMGVSRTTFVIDEEGTIQHIITKVDTENSTQQILNLVSGKA